MPTYMPPSALYRRITAIPCPEPQTTSNGRVKAGNPSVLPPVSMLGIVAESKPSEVERYHQLDIRITHTIVERGSGSARAGWTLTADGRTFRVKATDNPGLLNAYTLYYCEEVLT